MHQPDGVLGSGLGVLGTARAGRVILDMTVAAVPDGVRGARVALGHAIAGHVADVVRSDAELLVSELVTNSVRHAGLRADELVRLGALILGDLLRLEVDDPGTSGVVAVRERDIRGGGGFGLSLVQALAHGWGVSRDGHTRVWVELTRWPVAA